MGFFHKIFKTWPRSVEAGPISVYVAPIRQMIILQIIETNKKTNNLKKHIPIYECLVESNIIH